MRVLSCKLKCLSICFSNSSHSLQSPSSLTLEDDQHNVSSQSPVSHVSEEQSTEEKIGEVEKIESGDVKVESFPKSSLKKSPVSESEEVGKGRVKWMDFVGKELAEIREFEPIESGEAEDEDTGNQACICVIQ